MTSHYERFARGGAWALLMALSMGCPRPIDALTCPQLDLVTQQDGACSARLYECSDAVEREVVCELDGDTLRCTCFGDGAAEGEFFSDDYCEAVATAQEPTIREATVAGCPWDLRDPLNPSGDG